MLEELFSILPNIVSLYLFLLDYFLGHTEHYLYFLKKYPTILDWGKKTFFNSIYKAYDLGKF